MRLFIVHKTIVLALCLGVAGSALFGLDTPIARIADDSALRTSVKDTWLAETPSRVITRPRTLHTLPNGQRVEIRVEAGQDEFAVLFARELNGAGGAGATASAARSGEFPGWAQGSWLLTRRRDTGAATRIRVFLRSDPYTYVQFRPLSDDKCQMDMVLYDAYAIRALPLAVSFERLYTMPVQDVLNLAGDKFPRKYFEPDQANYRDHRLFIARVRERLPQLNFADDGAIDEAGRYVYIETGLEQEGAIGLNCSGFAKWLIDGILRPVTGERLAIPPMKAPFGDRGSSFTDPWEASYDPFFGLDWIRNLASRAWTTLRAPSFGTLDEIEVRAERFSQVIARERSGPSVQSYPGFLENAGYGINGLLPLLYTLAIDEPGRFFLAAVNTEGGPPSTPDNPRGMPRMRRYYHIAALIPYFNEDGAFQVAVFESAAETSITAFRTRYTIDNYVNLVRVPLETVFNP